MIRMLNNPVGLPLRASIGTIQPSPSRLLLVAQGNLPILVRPGSNVVMDGFDILYIEDIVIGGHSVLREDAL